MSKVITWVVIAVVVVGGLWYFLKNPSSSAPAATTQTQTQTPAQNTVAQQAPVDTSDAALTQDAASLDAQLQAASDASASAGQADTPVVQTE